MKKMDIIAIVVGGFLGLGIAYNLGLIATNKNAGTDTIMILSYAAMVIGCMVTGALSPYGGGYLGGSVRNEPINGAVAGILMVILTNYWLTGVHTIPLTDAGPLVIASFLGFFAGFFGSIIFIFPRKRRYVNELNKNIEYIDEFINSHPQEQCAIAWYNKANALFRLKRFEEAVSCYEKSLEIDPALEEAKKWMEVSRSKIGKKAGS